MKENILIAVVFIFMVVCAGLSGYCFYKLAEGIDLERAEFMQKCEQYHKSYECVAMWRAEEFGR